MLQQNTFLLILIMILCTKLSAQNEIERCDFIPSQQQINKFKNQNSPTNQVFKAVQELSDEEKKRLINLYWEREREGEQRFSFQFNRDSIKWQIPIVAHILRLDSKQGGPAIQTVEDAIDKINIKFANTKLVFELCKIKFIYSDDLYNNYYSSDIDKDNDPTTTASYNLLDVKNQNVPNKINMYIFMNGETSWTYSPTKKVNKQHLMILADHLESDIVMAHEMAHWFDLIHTHGKSSAIRELVDGSNCKIAGDYVCDTPADPGLINQVNKACQYLPSNPIPLDANGTPYQPLVENIMSYSPRKCRNGFTPDQEDRILSAYLTLMKDRGYTLKRCK